MRGRDGRRFRMPRERTRTKKRLIDRDVVAPYDIRFSIRRPVTPSGDVDDFVMEVHGDVVLVADGIEESAGTVHAYVLQVTRAREAREPLWDIFDATGEGLDEVYEALFDDDEMKEGVCEVGMGSDVLYLNRAEVLPAHRGRGLGLMAVLRVIEDFGSGCAAAVLKAFPLQLEGVNDTRPPSPSEKKHRRTMKYDALEQDPKRATRSLERHWRKLGFEKIRGTQLFLIDLAMQRPTYEDLLRS